MENWKTISPPEKIPSNFIDAWDSEWGCPVRDEEGNLLGYAAKMPSQPNEEIEVIDLKGNLHKIVS